MPFSLFGLISIRVCQIPMRQFEFLQFFPMFLTWISSAMVRWKVFCIAAALKLLQCLARGLIGSDVWCQSPDRCLPDGIIHSCRHQELNQKCLCSLLSYFPAGQSDLNRYFKCSFHFLFYFFTMFSASLQQLWNCNSSPLIFVIHISFFSFTILFCSFNRCLFFEMPFFLHSSLLIHLTIPSSHWHRNSLKRTTIYFGGGRWPPSDWLDFSKFSKYWFFI